MRLVLHIEADYSACNQVGSMEPIVRFLVDKEPPFYHELLYCPNCGKVWAKRILLTKDGLADPSRFTYTPTECQGSILGSAILYSLLDQAASLNRQQQGFLIYEYIYPYTELARSNDGDLAAAFRAAGRSNPYFQRTTDRRS